MRCAAAGPALSSLCLRVSADNPLDSTTRPCPTFLTMFSAILVDTFMTKSVNFDVDLHKWNIRKQSSPELARLCHRVDTLANPTPMERINGLSGGDRAWQ
ncbi:hypothetical protein H0H93_015418, partial [Arthromyces matolae]